MKLTEQQELVEAVLNALDRLAFETKLDEAGERDMWEVQARLEGLEQHMAYRQDEMGDPR